MRRYYYRENRFPHYLNERLSAVNVNFGIKGFDEFLLANGIDLDNITPKTFQLLTRLEEDLLDAFDNITDYIKSSAEIKSKVRKGELNSLKDINY